MRFSSLLEIRGCCAVVLMACAGLAIGPCAVGQIVHVDTTATHAVKFDPDKALGTSMDILPAKEFDTVYSEAIIEEGLSAGWGPITYRQNTELTYSAWHWNPNGMWSNEKEKNGYFVGNATPTEFLRSSFGYRLPHRGTTRSDAGQAEYSRMTDGDSSTYWKSNPYLSEKFTGEPHPQWVVIEFGLPQEIDAIRIDWANPYAKKYVVQYWTGKEDALNKQTSGAWVNFPQGEVNAGTGGGQVQRLSDEPIQSRFLRIWMTESSNTCDTHGSDDVRNCVGYAISEISAGTFNSLGQFVDLVKHTPSQAQTVTQASSQDPWHTEKDIISSRIQTGFDLFFTSGYTNHLPAMIPIALIYANPEDAASELAYIEKRGYPVSYVEMGEEPDGAYMVPEDYAALYLQFAAALHKVDPKLKLGGPVFTGVNEDIKTWPNEKGQDSWLGRFIAYQQAHGRMEDLSFVSFEHYPLDPCVGNWSDLYREPALVARILKAWRADGVPENVPLMNTESNVSWSLTDPMQDLFAGLWLADSVGAYLQNGGPGAVYYHSPIQPEPLRSGCQAWTTYGNFVADEDLKIRHHTAQYFASQMLNLDWVKHGGGEHQLYGAVADLQDEAKHELITTYAVKRPDGQWSLMIINKDPSNAHEVKIALEENGKDTGAEFSGEVQTVTFGAAEYVWRPSGSTSHADPAGPAKRATVQWKDGQTVALPKASVTVLTGKVSGR
ncbi:MAG TPA: discoidin domain-containing protein [Candidatus Saccharimonadales bacterium]|nr:discoidin domain-containing protein [Candidatus Saccharimonadales bacterium]